MSLENGTQLDVIYDDKILGNVIDPNEWNDNFKEIENKCNSNIVKFNSNFAKLNGTTGSAEIGSPAIAGLGESADSNIYAQLLLATTAILDRYTKADIDAKTASDADKYIANITLNQDKDLEITWGDNDKQVIILDLEKIPANFGFSEDGKKLVITNQDGSKYETDVTSLINLYNFNDSATIDFTASGYEITATINAGSIKDTMLDSALITQLQGYVSSASASAVSANSSKVSAESARDIAVNAKESALSSANVATTKASEASAYASQTSTDAQEASAYASSANTSKINAEGFATNSKSWAIGGTNTRTGEDTDNAKYYAQQAQSIADGSGYMTKLIYDKDDTGIVDNSKMLNGHEDTYFAKEAEVFKKDGSVQMTGVLKTVGSTPITPTRQIDMGENSIYSRDSQAVYLTVNCYHDGTDWRYKEDGTAMCYTISAEYGMSIVNIGESGLKDSVIQWTINNVLTDKTGLPLTGGIINGNITLNTSTPRYYLNNLYPGQEALSMLYSSQKMTKLCQYGASYVDDNNRSMLVLTHNAPTTLNNILRLQKVINGASSIYNVYGEHNITVSQSAPTSALPNGAMHNVY